MRGRSRFSALVVAVFTLFAGLGALFAPPAQAEVNVYSTPGIHTVNGRTWRTWCERYSQTVRCHTDLWASTVLRAPDGRYYLATYWTFNNLTYLQAPRSMWGTHHLANTGAYTIAGRQWKTECNTPRTGNGCRNYIYASVMAAVATSNGTVFVNQKKWVLNSMVQFGTLRTDLASLVVWRPPVTTPPPPPPLPPATPTLPVISSSAYNINKGPNTTTKVTLTYDDCPKSLAAFKETVLAAKAAGIGLALLPTGDCIRSGKFDAAFARANGQYVFNHSVSHPQLTGLSYSGVVAQLGAPGVVTTYGRPPYGAWNSTVKRAYDAVGMRIWIWDVDTNDWRGKSQSQVVSYVVANAKAGNSVLMHMQWNGFNPSAIRAMKSGLAAKGISVCKVYPGTTPVKPSAMGC